MKVGIRSFVTLTLMTLLAVSSQASASNLSYDYIAVAYLESDTDIDGTDLDGDGYGFAVSRDIADSLAVFFSYQDEEYDFDFEGDALSFGIDYHTPFSETGDIVVSFSLIDVEVSQPILGSEDDTGNIIQFGIRNQISGTAEVSAFISRTDVFDDTETSFGFGLALGAADGIQFTLGYGSGDDTDVISIGVRANY